MVDERTVRVGEMDLAVLEAGSGGRPLLLVHGFTGAKEDFGLVVESLAEDGSWVVAPDLRGHGASSKPGDESDYGVEMFVADLLGLISALGWERTDLLGHSFGGMVVQFLALARPDLINRLVLMDTGPGQVDGMDPEIMQMGIDLCRSDGLEAIMTVQKMGESALDSPAHKRMLAADPRLQEWEDSKMRACSPAMWCSVVAQLMSVEDRLSALRSLALPTLVLVGEQDGPFRAASDAMTDALPDARLVVVPDAGHSPQLENPSEWLQAVSTFLS